MTKCYVMMYIVWGNKMTSSGLCDSIQSDFFRNFSVNIRAQRQQQVQSSVPLQTEETLQMIITARGAENQPAGLQREDRAKQSSTADIISRALQAAQPPQTIRPSAVRLPIRASVLFLHLFLDVLGGPTLNVSNEVVVEMGGQGRREGSGSVCRSLARPAAGGVGRSGTRCVGVHAQTVLAAAGRQQGTTLHEVITAHTK